MEENVQNAFDAVRNFDNKAFRSGCYAPFVSLYFTTLGDVLACCKNQTFVLGNVEHQRLNEIWNGGKIKTLRKALANYRYETGCEFCEWQIAGGDFGALPMLFEEFAVTSKEPEWPAMIEFAGSNNCNYECIMCCGELSSSIRAHRDGLPPLPRFYDEQFFQDLRSFLPHLKRAKFLGGEPFLAKETFQIWDMMIEDGVIIPCHVTTNGSQYNTKVTRVLEALPISLTVSLDGVTKKTVESIRVHANCEELMINLRRFREYARNRGTYFSLAFCLMRQNWHEFGDLLLLAEDLECEVYVNTVVNPSYCSLYTLPAEELNPIVKQLETQESSLKARLRLNARVWEDNISKLRSNCDQSQAEKIAKVREEYFFGPDEHELTVACRFKDKGLYAEALKEAQKISEKNAYYYHSLALCGDIRRLMGDFEGAERDLNRAIEMSQRMPEAFVFRARLRLKQNRFEEAVEDALRARERIKDGDLFEQKICEVLGTVYSCQGKFVEAVGVLDRLLELQPKNSSVRVQRGMAFLKAGMREQALAEAETALALDPDNIAAIQLRGKV